MAIQIFSSGNSIVALDTVTGKIKLDRTRSTTYYNYTLLNNGMIEFISLDDKPITLPKFNLSDAIDGNSIAYTATTFREFCNDILGFISVIDDTKPSGTASFTTTNPSSTVIDSAIKSTDTIVIMPIGQTINELFIFQTVSAGSFVVKRLIVNSLGSLTNGLTYKWKVI